VHKFSDFAKAERRLDGEKVKIDTILDKEVEFTGYRISKSKMKDCETYLTMQFKQDDQLRVVFTSSKVLADQFEKYVENLPFLATIRYEGKYYTLS
jgi:hypothetical protein